MLGIKSPNKFFGPRNDVSLSLYSFLLALYIFYFPAVQRNWSVRWSNRSTSHRPASILWWGACRWWYRHTERGTHSFGLNVHDPFYITGVLWLEIEFSKRLDPELPFYYYTSGHSHFYIDIMPDFSAPATKPRKARHAPQRELPDFGKPGISRNILMLFWVKRRFVSMSDKWSGSRLV